MEITPKLSHYNRELVMFIFMLRKSGIYHNVIVIMPLINISKNVSIHESPFKCFFFFFFFFENRIFCLRNSLCKYPLVH